MTVLVNCLTSNATVQDMSEEKNIEARIKQIIQDQLNVPQEKITPEAKFLEELGADSLDTVELVMAVEEEFNVEIPDDKAEQLQSVGAVIQYVEEAQGES